MTSLSGSCVNRRAMYNRHVWFEFWRRPRRLTAALVTTTMASKKQCPRQNGGSCKAYNKRKKRNGAASNTADIRRHCTAPRNWDGGRKNTNRAGRKYSMHEKRKAVTAKRLLPTRGKRPMHDVDRHCVSLEVSSPCSEHRRRHNSTARRRARQMS